MPVCRAGSVLPEPLLSPSFFHFPPNRECYVTAAYGAVLMEKNFTGVRGLFFFFLNVCTKQSSESE